MNFLKTLFQPKPPSITITESMLVAAFEELDKRAKENPDHFTQDEQNYNEVCARFLMQLLQEQTN